MAGAGNQPNHMRARKWHGRQVADGHTDFALSAVAALVTALPSCGGSASVADGDDRYSLGYSVRVDSRAAPAA